MSSRPIASRTGVRVGAAALAAVVLVTSTVLAVTRPWEPPPGPPPCPPAAYQATQSVARRWDDALLDAIRRALPNPPVHARNLFHVSVAMWDAWAAYVPTAMGYLFKEKLKVDRCERVCRAQLQTGESAARRGAPRYQDRRSEPLAAAPGGISVEPERRRVAERRADSGRPALGARHLFRDSPRWRGGRAVRSR